ncbi:hypothetical protein HDE_12946 [Halotydeus destructor]|nr:hypothetical protein HDE_12946 [Halotydeus destructor]
MPRKRRASGEIQFPASLNPAFGSIIFKDVPSIALVKLRRFEDPHRAFVENALAGRFKQNFFMAKPDLFDTARKVLEAIIHFDFLHHSHYIELPYWFEEVFEHEPKLKFIFLDSFRNLKKLPYPLRRDWETISYHARVALNLEELKIRGSSPCSAADVKHFLGSLDHAHDVKTLDIANPLSSTDGALVMGRLIAKLSAGHFNTLKQLSIVPHRFETSKLQELAKFMPEQCRVIIKFRGTSKLHDDLSDLAAAVQKTTNFIHQLGCKLESVNATLKDYMLDEAISLLPYVEKLKLLDTGEAEFAPISLSDAQSLVHLFYLNPTASSTALFQNLSESRLPCLSKVRLHLTPTLFDKIGSILETNGQNLTSLDFNSRLFPNDEMFLSKTKSVSRDDLRSCDLVFGCHLQKNINNLVTDCSVLANILRWAPRLNRLSLTLSVPAISFCALVRLLLTQERRGCRMEMFDYRPETIDDIIIPIELLGFVCGLVKHAEYLSISFSATDRHMEIGPSRWLSEHTGYAEFIITTETSQWIEQQYNGTHELRKKSKARHQFRWREPEKRKYDQVRRSILELQYQVASCVTRVSRWILLRDQDVAYISTDVSRLSDDQWDDLDANLSRLEKQETLLNQKLVGVFASAH